ncbi:L-type lectin-domain containing receptor kinase SIT2-like [Zingiber officinale]|uniref:L-type lectin-domain containing receptor kinase SIT2-like n=1 Tax=Zingiber officinale TaxID=94328 RepID=UPI001C4BECD4|nr:L-type lectin-domain containing receptor kinase SIT2-like [Zingiber officinale]
MGTSAAALSSSDDEESVLSLAARLKIIKGVAAGLLYLHQDWEQVVIHRDIKASNVLLDEEFNARLGDFGLARLYDHGADLTSTNVVGTMGYLAPELARTGKPSTAADVFAFGTFVLEVVCGRRPVSSSTEEQVVLVDWVVENWRTGSITSTRDARMGVEEYEAEEVELALKVGLLCSHPLPAARPSIRQTMRYLEGEEPLPDLSPTYMSFSVLAMLHNDDFFCPSLFNLLLAIHPPLVARKGPTIGIKARLPQKNKPPTEAKMMVGTIIHLPKFERDFAY